ncbi:MAG: hypothetical protein OEW08_06265 [Gammaproteobacteria bacterium]|nr:hypothetical protein [Gammaproteobacteria bacterium]
MRITYTAAREIIKLGYDKSGTAISASAVDNSYNCATVDLSGISAGQYVLVSGYVNAANNGYHQVVSSTAAKVVVSETLVTEAAGPQVVLDGRLHAVGSSYNLEIGAQVLSKSREVIKQTNRALDGTAEAVITRAGYLWAVKTARVTQANLPIWEEFLASVEGNETFTLDPYGTVAVPDKPVTVEITDTPRIERIKSLMAYYASFSVRQI